MSDSHERRLPGRRIVIYLYVIVVAIATGTGFLLGVIRPKGLDPELFGVVQLPPTPLGMALYGGVTLAVVLGVVLLAVQFVSRRYDDPKTASD